MNLAIVRGYQSQISVGACLLGRLCLCFKEKITGVSMGEAVRRENGRRDVKEGTRHT